MAGSMPKQNSLSLEIEGLRALTGKKYVKKEITGFTAKEVSFIINFLQFFCHLSILPLILISSNI